MIVIRQLSGSNIILGTNGEKAIIEGLRLLYWQNESQRKEALNLLKHLGATV